MKFSDIIGQELAKEQLRKMVLSKRLPHAILLLGFPGSGDLSLSLAFSQFIVCENRLELEACGICSHCLKAAKMVHPDIHYSFPTVGANVLSDDLLAEWRAAVHENSYLDTNQWIQRIANETSQGNINAKECGNILKKLSFKTFESEYKVLLMWLPEFLGKEGNRLLKIIEEPPENTVIILVAQNIELILNTILSRCQLIKVNRLSDQAIEEGLIDKAKLTQQKAQAIAQIADGNFNQALKMAENPTNDNSGLFLDWLRKCYEGNSVNIANWVENFTTQNRESQKHFLQYGLYFLREFLLLKTNSKLPVRFQPEELNAAHKLDKILGFEKIEQLVRLCDDCSYHIERNANQKLLFLNASIKVNRIFRD